MVEEREVIMNFESWNRLAISLCKDFKALQPERIVSNYNSSILDTRYALFHTSLQCFCEEGATCMKLKRTVVVQGIQKLEICWGFKPWKLSLLPARTASFTPDPSIEKYDEAGHGPYVVNSCPLRSQ